MKILVGLGNPGARYARNRHNLGFMAVDEIIRQHSFSSERTKFQALIREGLLDDQKVISMKPATYMNDSGRAVSEIMRFYKLDPDDIIVIHDEIALPASRVRVKKGGGSAGNNGIKSIAHHCGENFHRVRIGIAHPGNKEQVHAHVMGDFTKQEMTWVTPLLDAIGREAPLLVQDNFPTFANRIHLALDPPQKTGTKTNGSGSGAGGLEEA